MSAAARSHFLLVGSSLYANRGCEAIVRGTMAVLRRAFGDQIRVTAASFGPPELIREQALTETDPAIRHVPLLYGRFSIPWALDQFRKRLKMPASAERWILGSAVKDARVALEIGGDNYSLDYGAPREFMALDRFLVASGLPVVLWGASVGPFDADSEFEKEMLGHLRTLSGIYARESSSAQYLESRGLSAVRRVADPAFVMEATEPPESKSGLKLSEGAIGVNFSPHMALYVTEGDLDRWRHICSDAIVQTVRQTGREVLLVPHVFLKTPYNDDHGFLVSVSAQVHEKAGLSVPVLAAGLAASQIKWMIAKCAVFAGCRTHSTIAALSSGVPTLSLAYSRKARGLNQDIYDSLEYCLDPSDMTADLIAQRLERVLANSPAIRERLAALIPTLKARAFAAGEYLAECLQTSPAMV